MNKVIKWKDFDGILQENQNCWDNTDPRTY